ncbi:MAG: response regulator transcription factor [Bacteroidetes bacterium]|nr:response regulator transcription factor [Bacteroidota bacterium]
MKLNCIIVDDEPIARKVLEEYIEDIDFLTLCGKAENPHKAMALLEQFPVDLVFLDINMPGMTGIDFLKHVPTVPPTILTTAYIEYAVDGFELDVLDYLVKPFSPARFLKACTRAREFIELKKQSLNTATPATQEYFFVKCDGIIEKVLYNELLYIEAMQNYVVLRTEHKKMVVYLTIKGVEAQLPADNFLKIHKSTIVNKNKIRAIEGHCLHVGQEKLTISQSLFDSVMDNIVRDRLIKR